jgi:hypothetical protein
MIQPRHCSAHSIYKLSTIHPPTPILHHTYCIPHHISSSRQKTTKPLYPSNRIQPQNKSNPTTATMVTWICCNKHLPTSANWPTKTETSTTPDGTTLSKTEKIVQHGSREGDAWKSPTYIRTCTFPGCDHERCVKCTRPQIESWA